MNELEEIFKVQKEFNDKYFREQQNVDDVTKMSIDDKIKWSKEFIFSSSKELYEMIDELQWKKHRFICKTNNIDNFLEEGIDAFKFLLNLFLVHGCDSTAFFQKFVDKSKVVDIRYNQEKKLKELKSKKDIKLAVLDIDGIICSHSVEFLRGTTYNTIYEFKNDDINLYNEKKYSFRVSGIKRNLPVKPYVYNFLQTLKNKGYLILLLSARPYEKFIRIYADTLYWLENNDIKYDFLFFNKNKEQFIIDNVLPEQVKFCVDDGIDNVNKLSLYFKTYLLPNYYLYDKRELFKVKNDVQIIDTFNNIQL